MENKNGFKIGIFVGIFIGILTAFSVSVALVSFGEYRILRAEDSLAQEEQKGTDKEKKGESASKDEPGLDLNKINRKIVRLEKLIESNFLFEKDAEKMEDGVYKGLMSGLDDPYTTYYNKEDFDAVTTDTSGVYSGIGAVVNQNPDTGIVTVMKVFDGSPSKEAGIIAGDIIYKIDGEEIDGIKLDVLVSTKIRGEEGSSLDVTVIRGEDAEEITYTVVRKSIEVPTVEHKMLGNNVGYVAVSQFDLVTYDQFVAAVEDLKKQGMSKLVLDFRSNPGGILDTCVEMLDYILPNGLLVYTADRDGKGDKYFADDGKEIGMPVSVLVNKYSASASEIFSGAVKDFSYGKVVGEKTFGKGIVQNMIPLGDGTAVKITTQHYYTPSGFDLHKKGIEPDIAVELNKDATIGDPATDNQLQEAIKALDE